MGNVAITILENLKSIGPLPLKLIKGLDLIVGGLIALCIKARERRPMSPDIDSILVIRPGGMGDAVFLIPFLNMLKKENPGIKIDVLAEKRNKSIFQLVDPGTINTIYSYDLFADVKKVFKNQYDVVVDTEQWHFLSSAMAYFLSPKITVGFATRRLRSKFFNIAVTYEINAYETENFSRLFKSLILSRIEDINSTLLIPSHLQMWAKDKLPEQTIALSIGGSIFLRRFSDEQCVTMIKEILQRNYNVALLGGRDVKDVAQRVEKRISDPKLISFVGEISLAQTAAIIRQCRKFIGTDSGLLHLACAVGTPTVGIFGPGNVKKWGPRGGGHTIVTENLPCAPCTRFGYTIPTCGGRYQCMKNIKIEKIIETITFPL